MASSVGRLVEYNETLRLLCRNPKCRRVVEPDVIELARRLGEDYDVLDFGRRARCMKCADSA